MSGHDDEIPLSGSIPIVAGAPGWVRIPIPGTPQLAVEFWPRDPFWKGKSTSTIFIQDVTGTKKLLRLDYGPNPVTKGVDYHWNRKGLGNDARFGGAGLADHTLAGRVGQIAYRTAKAYRWAGRTLVVVGLGIDAVSVVQASHRLRRASEVVSAWALAWAGCKAGGYVGGAIGTAIEPGLGTAAGAIGGCIVGGWSGYEVGERVGGAVYAWAEGTVFRRLPVVPRPAVP